MFGIDFGPSSWILAAVKGLASGLIGPVFTHLDKKTDDTLEGFKTAGTLDTEQYKAMLDHDIAIQQLKLQANSWWGPRMLYVVVGSCVALHTCAVFIDSTIPMGCGHYGCWGIPKLPPDYFKYEVWVVSSLFVVSVVEKPLNALTNAWIGKK